MRTIRDPAQLQKLVCKLPAPIVLVPTMGALHEGHLALVQRAKALTRRQGTVATSIFVNPTQFGPNEDFSRYPRPFARDRRLLQETGCDLLFAPAREAMYATDRSVAIVETALARVMCGSSRPGHFDGVCTVVAKLFNLFRPHRAIFGAKDYQQFAIIRRMVRDLNFPVALEAHPTVREADGLALSSRNVYLSPDERAQAPIIQQTLAGAADKVRGGESSTARLTNWMRRSIEKAPAARVDYAVAVDPETLVARATLRTPLLLAAAVYFGPTRLIDNILVT
jgi:pantoate--beta-alanine ligase